MEEAVSGYIKPEAPLFFRLKWEVSKEDRLKKRLCRVNLIHSGKKNN